MIAKMTPIETLLDWLGKNHYYIGNDLLEKIEELKQMEKLKNHSEYMRGWYNGFNSQEIETKGLEKTAVEWLYNKMYEYKGIITISEYEQAKEMEKQQIIEARITAPLLLGIDKLIYLNEAQQYYNETFKS